METTRDSPAALGRSAQLPALLAVATAALILNGCNPQGDEAERRAATEELPPYDSVAQEWEAFEAPAGFPLPFTTRIPPYFEARSEVDGPSAAISFFAAASEAGGDSALVHLLAFPAETTEGVAREIVRSIAERYLIPGSGTELVPSAEHEWAIVEYPIRSRGRLGEPIEGWVALGQKGTRLFQISAQSTASLWPVVREDVELILRGWQWAPSGVTPESPGF